MNKKEPYHYFLDPWYFASKEEVEGYLRNAGIDPEAARREFMAFIGAHDAKKDSKKKMK
jgi:hypothetical protein